MTEKELNKKLALIGMTTMLKALNYSITDTVKSQRVERNFKRLLNAIQGKIAMFEKDFEKRFGEKEKNFLIVDFCCLNR